MLPLIPIIAIAGVAYFFLKYQPTQAQQTQQSTEQPKAPTMNIEDQILSWLRGVDSKAASRAANYVPSIAEAETRYNIPDNILTKVLYQESRFRPDIILGATKSKVGAIGIAQFMPKTAAGMGVDPTDPTQSIDAAGKYLSDLFKQFGDWTKAVAAYNWGPGNVARKGLANAPTETVNYVAAVTGDNIGD